MKFPAQARTRRHSSVSQALARDRLGVPAVLFFVLAGVAPLTVAAGVIPTAYATTGLTGIPAAFVVIAVILAIWSPDPGLTTSAEAAAVTASSALTPGVPAGLGAGVTPAVRQPAESAGNAGRWPVGQT